MENDTRSIVDDFTDRMISRVIDVKRKEFEPLTEEQSLRLGKIQTELTEFLDEWNEGLKRSNTEDKIPF